MKNNVLFSKWAGNIMSKCYELVSVPVNHVDYSLSPAAIAYLSSQGNSSCCFEILSVANKDESEITGIRRRTFIVLHMVAARNRLNLFLDKAYRFANLLTKEDYVLDELDSANFAGISSRVMSHPFKASSFPTGPASLHALPMFIENACIHIPAGTAYSLTIVKSRHGNGYVANGLICAAERSLLTTAANPLPLWSVWSINRTWNKDYIPFRMDVISRRDRKQDVVLSEKSLNRILGLPSGRSTTFKCTAPRCETANIPPSLMSKDHGIMVGYVPLPGGGLRPLYLHSGDFCRHVCIIGKSGYGKSSLLEHIMAGCRQSGLNLLCLDVEGTDLRDLAPTIDADVYTINRKELSPYPINPFRIEGLDDRETSDMLKEILTNCLDLWSPLDIYMKEALDAMYSHPTAETRSLDALRSFLRETFKQNKYSADNSSNILTAADARLRDLSFLDGGTSVFNVRDLLQRSSIFELRGVDYAHDRLFILALLLSAIFRIKKKDREMGRESKPLLVVIDEAHVVLSKGPQKTSEFFNNLIQRILKEGRKYNLWLVCSDQDPSLLREVIQNVDLKIIMRSEIETAALAQSLQTPKAEEHLRILQVGEAYLRAGGMDAAVFISTPPPLVLDKLDNESLAKYMAQRGTLKTPVELVQMVESSRLKAGYPRLKLLPESKRENQDQEEVRMIADRVISWVLYELASNDKSGITEVFNLKSIVKSISPNNLDLLPEVEKSLKDRFEGSPRLSFLWRSKY